jgi:hypothetical protein
MDLSLQYNLSFLGANRNSLAVWAVALLPLLHLDLLSASDDELT